MMLIIRKCKSYSKNVIILFQADDFLWIRLGYALCIVKKRISQFKNAILISRSRLLIVIKQESCVLKVRKTVLNLRSDWITDFCVVEKYSNQ